METALAASLPGGDPLTAAMAAGETPSPEMVAAAEGAGALPPWVAVTCLAVVLVGLVVCTFLSKYAMGVNRLPLDSPDAAPAALAAAAREIVRELGYEDRPRYSAYGYSDDNHSYGNVLGQQGSRLETGQPAALYFWYRQSPWPLPRRTASAREYPKDDTSHFDIEH